MASKIQTIAVLFKDTILSLGNLAKNLLENAIILSNKYNLSGKAKIITDEISKLLKPALVFTKFIIHSAVIKIIIPSILFVFPKFQNFIEMLSSAKNIFSIFSKAYNIFRPIQNLAQNFITTSIKLAINNFVFPVITFVFPSSKDFINTISSSFFNNPSEELSKTKSLVQNTFSFYYDNVQKFSPKFSKSLDNITGNQNLTNEQKFGKIFSEVKDFILNIFKPKQQPEINLNEQSNENTTTDVDANFEASQINPPTTWTEKTTSQSDSITNILKTGQKTISDIVSNITSINR